MRSPTIIEAEINKQLLNIYKSLETDYCGKPPCAGVYFVCARNQDEYYRHIGKERIIYIGASKNINKRITKPAHPYMLAYYKLKNCAIYTRSFITDDYFEYEKLFINYFKPLLNKNHKNGKAVY